MPPAATHLPPQHTRRAILGLAAALAFVLPARAAAPASSAPKVTATAPVKNFRLPTFTPEGYRHTMLRAGEARLPDPARIDVAEMELTLFTGHADEQIDAMLAAPSATFLPETLQASGTDTVRLERRDLTVTGANWSYDHPAQKIIIRRDAHLTLHAPLGDLIK